MINWKGAGKNGTWRNPYICLEELRKIKKNFSGDSLCHKIRDGFGHAQ